MTSPTASSGRPATASDRHVLEDLQLASRNRVINYFDSLATQPDALRQLITELLERSPGTTSRLNGRSPEPTTVGLGHRFDNLLSTIDGGLADQSHAELPDYWRAQADPLVVPQAWLDELGSYTVTVDPDFEMPDITLRHED